MAFRLKFVVPLAVVAIGLSACTCFATGGLMSSGEGDEAAEQSWNREQKNNVKADARTMFQQKSQARAQQRLDRLATSNWYGISNSRPTGTATPFTSRYGSLWEMPGGRPYSWTPTWSRPNYVFVWPYQNY